MFLMGISLVIMLYTIKMPIKSRLDVENALFFFCAFGVDMSLRGFTILSRSNNKPEKMPSQHHQSTKICQYNASLIIMCYAQLMSNRRTLPSFNFCRSIYDMPTHLFRKQLQCYHGVISSLQLDRIASHLR